MSFQFTALNSLKQNNIIQQENTTDKSLKARFPYSKGNSNVTAW